MKEVENIKNLTDDQKKSLNEDIRDSATGSFSEIVNAKMNYDADIDNMKETYGISKKMAKRLVKTFYESSFEDEKEEFETFETIYNEVLG